MKKTLSIIIALYGAISLIIALITASYVFNLYNSIELLNIKENLGKKVSQSILLPFIFIIIALIVSFIIYLKKRDKISKISILPSILSVIIFLVLFVYIIF